MVEFVSRSADSLPRNHLLGTGPSNDTSQQPAFSANNSAEGQLPRDTAPTSNQPHRHTDRSHRRQHFGAADFYSQIVRELLRKVREDTDALPPDAYTNDVDAAPNASGLRCCEASMVRVVLGTGSDAKPRAAHINQIDFSRESDSHSRHAVFRAGQSPAGASGEVGASAEVTPARAGLSQACEKALLEGIESGLGVYQFVSRKAHAHPAESKETPILHLLQQCLASQHPGDPALLLGGRYHVTGFEVQQPEAHDHRHVLLTVHDTTLAADDANRIRTIPLTQAGMKFTGKLLDTAEITTASAVLDAHRKLIPEQILQAAHQAEPTIYSQAGIGRNATLITYRRIARLIRQNSIPDEIFLAGVLRHTIKIEREFCGKKFLHSEAQINALWLALSANFADHKAKQPVGDLPRSGVGVAAGEETSSTSARVVPDTTLPLNTAVESAATVSPGPTASTGNELKATVISNASVKSSNASPATAIPSPTIKSGKALSGTAIADTTIKLNNDATPTAIPRVRQTSQAVATDPFEELEHPANHYHANWMTGAILIYRNDPEKYQRFVAAFDAQCYSERNLEPGQLRPHGLLKHLSDRQLAAIKKHIINPGGTVNKQLPKPETEEEQELNAEAVRRAANGEDVNDGDSTRGDNGGAIAFQEGNFTTLPNRGGGNCLFHALRGTLRSADLSVEQVEEERLQTAMVRLHKPDTEAEMRSNWHEIYGIAPKAGQLRKAFEENGVPLELSNAQVSFFQQRRGYNAGDMEIADWLAIPGNKTEEVIVIDGQRGIESIVKFSRRGGRLGFPLAKQKGLDRTSADEVHGWVEGELAPALDDPEAFFSNETPRVVAIYRSVGHFERIVGFGNCGCELSCEGPDETTASIFGTSD